MSHHDPVVADLKPVKVALEKGQEYWFCACGRSQSQPFCDGSHAGTGIEPTAITAEQDGDAFLCQCKQTGNVPFCDGTHSRLPPDAKGRERARADGGDDDALPEAAPTP